MPELREYTSVFIAKIVELFGPGGRPVFEEIRSRINAASDEEHTHEDDTEGGKLNHNLALKNFDGGQAGQYNHLTDAELDDVQVDIGLNNTHRASDGNDHSNVVLNNTHRASDGNDHSNVVLNNTHRASNGDDHGYIDQDVTTIGDPTFNNVEIDGALNHDGATAGFFGTTPTTKSSAYTPTNVSADRAYDANATDVAELADVLGTLISDLQSLGLIG